MDEEKSFWGRYGEFAPLEDIARLEAPATVELALGACRRKLRFYFLTDEREPRVPYDKRKRKRFVKRFPLSDTWPAAEWVEAAHARRIHARDSGNRDQLRPAFHG
jgi:hypothetical protein